MKIIIIYIFGLSLVYSHPHHNHESIGNNVKNNGNYANLGIVNGAKSKKMLPYLCQILEDDNHICGCSILDNKTVLTAAHCYNKTIKASKYEVGVGHITLAKQDYYTAKKFIIHVKYNKGIKFDNDVAIIKLKDPIKMITGKVAPVKFFDCNEKLPYGQLALASGWGAFDEDLTEFPDDLYETKLKVLKNTDPGCVKYYKSKLLSKRMFCAGWSNGKSDVCGGDSGGPLVNKYNEQIGIVSWAIGCSRVHRSTVFTNICEVMNWIKKTWKKSLI